MRQAIMLMLVMALTISLSPPIFGSTLATRSPPTSTASMFPNSPAAGR